MFQNDRDSKVTRVRRPDGRTDDDDGRTRTTTDDDDGTTRGRRGVEGGWGGGIAGSVGSRGLGEGVEGGALTGEKNTYFSKLKVKMLQNRFPPG